MGFQTSHEVIPKPKGTVKNNGYVDTTSEYQTVAEITVTKDKIFQLAKITVSCKEDVWAKVTWNGVDVSIEYLIMGKIPFTDWFPWNWHPMAGDGAKKVELKVKYDSKTSTAFGELCGEEE